MADIKSRLMEVEGVGEAKAQAIIDAGFDTIEKIKKVSVEEISEARGISRSMAEVVKKFFSEEEAGVIEEEVKKPKEAEPEIVEEEKEVYLVKAKPKLSEEIAAKLREKKNIPNFKRQEWFRYKRLDTSYRRPKGLHSKARKHLRYRPPLPRIGYRTQVEIRGMHPSGFREVMVYRPKDLESIDPDKEAARIGSSVGGRKREDIIKLADKRGIRVLNRW